MRFDLNRESETPLYQQIEAYFRTGILSGGFLPETRLPASRQLAADLGVNRMTIETAYANLEADGLVYFKAGSGTYVLPPPVLTLAAKDNAQALFPAWQQALQSSPSFSDETLAEPAGLDLIRFAVGSGDSALFPADEFRKVLQGVMRRDGISALGYGELCGYAPLRATISQVLASQGIQARPENILITSGSQQAIALVAQLLLREGETVLVESPTYGGALDLFRQLRLRVVGVPLDANGMQVERLESLLTQVQPRLIYTMPNFQNPSGVCLSNQRRHELIALAGRYNTPILEDDYVGDLRYDGHAQPALKALDPGGQVIYVSTFSKMLMPGLRTGFLVAEGPVFENLAQGKRATDLAASNLIQRAVEGYVTVGRYQAHLRRSCQLYKSRRDAMLAALRRYLPKDILFLASRGGLFLWLQLPVGLSAEQLLPVARELGVDFASGTGFFPNSVDGENFLRLNFAAFQREQINEGIRRLGQAIGRVLK